MNQIIALKGISSGGSAPAITPSRSKVRASAISIEIRLLASCGDIRQAWADLATRAIEPNLFFEPDFALAATQHLVAFRDVAAILAWQGEQSDPERRLVGLIPCFPRNRLFVPDELIGFSDRRVFNGAPLIDALQAEAVISSVLSLRRGWMLEGRGLLLRQIDMESALAPAILRVAERLSLAANMQPQNQPIPLRPGTPGANDIETFRPALAQQGKLSLIEAGSRMEMRDAVEILLAMEASGPVGRAGKAVLQDTREVGFLRAMTRGLASSRQCRIGLLMLDEQPIAGAIVLGRARRGWLYMTAQDETYAAFTPERLLLARMRQATPARLILDPACPAIGPAAARFGELRLSPKAALKPRNLAGRARDALRRGLRLPPARAAG